ncbi:MAG: PKD domain-containing protein [Candidatus Gracilibacteria bacterium]|nr:PKD domain-containing protein [Candidatus Gracilibacteria bacterium]
MFKKIVCFFILYFIIFLGRSFADSVPVEQVFSDISKDYKYYNELQTLYDKGMIFPDSDGRFNPQKLLNRDEFVGIMMEVSCSKCISPNVSYDFLSKYENSTLFFDVNRTNKYFYCIAGADASSFVSGYQEGTKCEDGTFKVGEKPFCPNNTIILEEALAIILRSSGILTNEEANLVRLKIANGEITQNLADDVSPKNLDGSVYSFYPDFQKALDYQVVEYDKEGNQKIYKLVEKVDNKLRPKQAITKEDFLRISYVALKSNSCNEKSNDKLGLEINIYNKTCDVNSIGDCSISNLTGNEKVYDFYGNVALPKGDTISNNTGYIWRFYNYNTGETIIKYGQYLDNYDFLKDGDYRVFFRAVSDNGNTAEVYNDIHISSTTDENNNKLSIDANPIFGDSPLLINFSSIFSGDSNGSSYYWDFGDGTTSLGKTNNHIYKEPGVYKVTLTLKDVNGEIYSSTIAINVAGINSLDTDGDGVADSEDRQINTPKENILFICTLNDIQNKKYDCTNMDMLGVFSEIKKQSDTDGDGVSDKEDFEINTPSDKVLYICTLEDIKSKSYDCKSSDMLGVYSQVKENSLVGDYDNDGINNLLDACPEIKGSDKNKGCPIFDKLCSSDTDCDNGYYCNSGICSPKQVATSCEYTGGDLIFGNIVCNSCPCSNFVDFNSTLRKCDTVFPAIVSPDKKTIYSKGNYFQIK